MNHVVENSKSVQQAISDGLSATENLKQAINQVSEKAQENKVSVQKMENQLQASRSNF